MVEYIGKLFLAGSLLTIACTQEFYFAQKDTIPEFYERNQDCPKEDSESI